MFQSNKYTTCYLAIVGRAKTETRKKHTGIYYESHHIIPRSCGGDNSKNNLVLLTAKEHYICHLLLVKMTTGQNRYKMANAFMYMSGRNKHAGKILYASRSYETMKNAYSKFLRRPGMQKEKHPFYGKTSPFAGKTHSSEVRAKMSEKKLGKPGHKQTEKHKDNLRKIHSKTWKIIYPCGKEETITNLNEFCKKNGLHSQHMGKVASGERPHHKGYRCENGAL